MQSWSNNEVPMLIGDTEEDYERRWWAHMQAKRPALRAHSGSMGHIFVGDEFYGSRCIGCGKSSAELAPKPRFARLKSFLGKL